MDLNNIYIDDSPKEVKLEYKGVDIIIKVKPISWSRKNEILSECFSLDGMKFNFNLYIKTILSEMIVEAPWGVTNQIFLSKITPDFGAMLEKLVPKAFDEGTSTSFFVKE
jgi:hypothetical protein